MAIESRDILKTYFEAGDVPSQDEFGNLIDSFISRIDDGVYIFDVPASTEKRFGIGIEEPDYPLGIKAAGVNEGLISLHTPDDSTLWLINMLPDGALNRGLNFQQQTISGGETRLFINSATGNIGLGTLEPEALIQLEKSTPSDITGLKFLNTASVGNQGWRVGHLQDALTARDGSLAFTEDGPDAERMIIQPDGNVGINEALPDTKFHVSRPVSDPGAVISLVQGTGIALIGPITDNLVFDFDGIQARHGEYIGPVLDLQPADLHLQPLGGNLLIHGGDTTALSQKVMVTNDGLVGLGTITPLEKLDVDGGVKIGTTSTENQGTIRWTGADFEGRTGSAWVSLTAGNGPWSIGAGDSIYYDAGLAPRVGIGSTSPIATLDVNCSEAVTQFSNGCVVRNSSTTTSVGQTDNRTALIVGCAGPWGGDPLSKNIGLYVTGVTGQAANEVNLASVMNGNVVIGNLSAASSVIGTNGSRVLAIQNGTPPTTSATVKSVQLYSEDNSAGDPQLRVMTGNGDIIKIYREGALTPAMPDAFSPVYDGLVIDILNNMRARINELESRLQNQGLLT